MARPTSQRLPCKRAESRRWSARRSLGTLALGGNEIPGELADLGRVQVANEVRGCGGVALGDVLHDDIAEASVGGWGGCIYVFDNGEQGLGLAFVARASRSMESRASRVRSRARNLRHTKTPHLGSCYRSGLNCHGCVLVRSWKQVSLNVLKLGSYVEEDPCGSGAVGADGVSVAASSASPGFVCITSSLRRSSRSRWMWSGYSIHSLRGVHTLKPASLSCRETSSSRLGHSPAKVATAASDLSTM